MPAICWLKVTDYMHGWLQYELGADIRIKKQRVVCVQHLPGAREILRMETVEEMLDPKPIGAAMSATLRNCLTAGITLDPDVVEKMYGATKELMALFLPIECPKMCLTKYGVLRPWTMDVCFSRKQVTALQRLLRDEFWKAVGEFAEEYAQKHVGERYAQVDMVEEFCSKTATPGMYVDTIRREWQRRVKRTKEARAKAENEE